MTNERAREVATNILAHAWGDGSANYIMSEAEAAILAYRDEVRRETLDEAFDNLINAPANSRGDKNEIARGIHYSMERIHQMTLAIPKTTTSATQSGESAIGHLPNCFYPSHCVRSASPYCTHPDSGCPHARPPAPSSSHDADLDTVLRTLAQAYVGNDYTIEGRKFQDAVGRLWPK